MRTSSSFRPQALLGAFALALCFLGSARAGDEPGPGVRTGPKLPADAREPARVPPPGTNAPPVPKLARIALAVVQHQPEGAEQTPPAISVTFNQPMVPVSSVSEVAAAQVPMRVEPSVEGNARWIDTATYVIEPKARLRAATRYQVTVPAGTRSESGMTLASPFRYGFDTPRPAVAQVSPWDGEADVDLDREIVLTFNQPVSAEKIAPYVSLTSRAGKPVALQAVPRGTWPKSPRLSGYVGQARTPWIAVFAPTAHLAPNTKYAIEVRAGAQGDEGPLPLEKPYRSSFSTYPPLAVAGLQCRGGGGERLTNALECPVGRAVTIVFNHEVRQDSLAGRISIVPRPKDLAVVPRGSQIDLTGHFVAETLYRVEVAAGVKDDHGQTLERAYAGHAKFTHLPPELHLLVPEQALLESGGAASLPARVLNVHAASVTAYRVPNELIDQAMQAAREQMHSSDLLRALEVFHPQRVAAWSQPLDPPADHNAVRNISLKRLLRDTGPGAYLVTIDEGEHPVLVQLTDLGITARYDGAQLVALATSIATGKPLPGVKIALTPGLATPVVTGRDGIALLRATPHGADRRTSELRIFATLGRDHAFLRGDGATDDGSWTSLDWGGPRSDASDRRLLYADRDLYRPDDEVQVFGIDRHYEGGVLDRLAPPKARTAVQWHAQSARGRALGKGTAQLSAFGTFRFSLKLPATVDLGPVSIETESSSLTVDVQEYRAPEFEVAVSSARTSLLGGDTLQAAVRGRYLFGAPMRGANVSWSVLGEPGRFTPPGSEEFSFGSAVEPWREEGMWRGRGMGASPFAEGHGVLDAQGKLAVSVPLDQVGHTLDPTTLVLEAQVSDLSQQVVAGRVSALLHPGDRYVGVRAPLGIEAGRASSFELVLVDLDGKRVAGVPMTARAQQAFSWRNRESDGDDPPQAGAAPATAGPCRVVSALTPQACALSLPTSGQYLVTVDAVDSRGRAIQTQAYVQIEGRGKTVREVAALRLELAPDRKVYEPGQTAQVTLRAPFDSGVALVTEGHRGMLGYRLVKIAHHTATMSVLLHGEHVPNVELAATAIASRETHGAERAPPAWAKGSVSLAIARTDKRLELRVRPAKDIARPGESVPIEVAVKDAQHRAASAQVSVLVVDEAVLSMTGLAAPDPLTFFHALRESGVAYAELLRELVAEPDPREVSAKRLGDSAKEDASGERISSHVASMAGAGPAGARAVRRVFATAPLVAQRATDREGVARFTLRLPDNLTRYRVLAVASDAGDRFGTGLATVTARKLFQVRAAVPRFANTSDAFTASALVDNQTTHAGEASVVLAGEGLELVGPATQTIGVPPGEVRELRFSVRASHPGSATLRFAARLGQESDAVEAIMPVWTPATTEAFATYGITQDTVAQPILAPRDAMPDFGELSITLASTALTGLQDAARYLIDYPYDCVEQVASHAMPVLVLGDLLAEFKIGGAGAIAEQRQHASNDVARLISGQRQDGGWGSWWSDGYGSRPDLTAYVLLVLRRAQERGIDVPAETVQRASSWLRTWMRSQQVDKREEWRARWTRDTQAFGLYVLGDWGERDPELAKQLFADWRALDLHAQAMLAAVFHRLDAKSPECATLLRELENRVIQTAAAARFQEQQSEALQLLMHSSARTDAIALLVLLEIDPQNVLVPKVARGLMDARVGGRWDTTQSNAYALWSLVRYFKVHEAEPTSFVAKMWLGDGFLGEQRFAERTMNEARVEVPLAKVLASHAGKVTIGKTGSGRLYYRVGLRYAPKNLALQSLDRGFVVERSYEPIGDKGDVRHLPDGSWSVKAGAYVRVHLRITAPSRRYYVAVDDPLPAGLELVNTAFKTSARDRLTASEGEDGGGSSWAFAYRELKDERSVHYADAIEPGRYQLTVIARATSRGTFIVPPTRAEEMYRPEVFGRGATDHVIVE